MTIGRITVFLCCSSLAACSGQIASTPTPAQSVLGSPTPTVSPMAPPTPANTTAPVSSLAPFTCTLPVSRPAWGSGLAQPTTARVGGQPDYDRIVFEYAGTALPSLSVTAVSPPFVSDPSGRPLTVSGIAFLEIVFRELPGIGSGYTGPSRFKAGLPILTDLEPRGDFEGVQQWIVGLSGQACVRVFSLTSPTRLVIDLEKAP